MLHHAYRRQGWLVTAWFASSRRTKLPPSPELIPRSSHPKTLSGASAQRLPSGKSK
ncbi:hypothetical protein WN48_09985 [Eufriesea mexicana]|uniref:Uncharacterized protein n=1 Tax=Eufriesea mexicana TaxID=516756 RepID=A0A310SIP6_9HYME|nr:hypothetical protein WN48_09985 [Eufriesea mexicana]